MIEIVRLDTGCKTIGEWIKLSNLDDFYDYVMYRNEGIKSVISKLRQSGIPVEKWDHFYVDTEEGNTFLTAVHTSKIVQTMSVFESLDDVRQRVFNAMSKYIRMGEIVYVNRKGGWHTKTSSSKEVGEPKPFLGWDISNYFNIKENTTYLNLENDPELEQYTKTVLGSVDENYSYVTNLRSFNSDQLYKIFTEFVNKGGLGLWVYTTAMDVEQLKDYCTLALSAGILHYVFIFSANPNAYALEFLGEFEKNNKGTTVHLNI